MRFLWDNGGYLIHWSGSSRRRGSGVWPIGEYICQLPDGSMLRLNGTTQNRIVEVLEMKAWMPRLGAASSIAESVALGQKWYSIIDRDTKSAEQFRRLVHRARAPNPACHDLGPRGCGFRRASLMAVSSSCPLNGFLNNR